MTKPRLNAVDVLNWDYLREVAEEHPDLAFTTDIDRAVEKFAFAFTEAADTQDQNEILVQLLQNATFAQSKKANEATIECFAEILHSDSSLLREFAKQEGIRLPARRA